MFDNIFKLKENGTTAKTEIGAGLTTFMTMAYILAVNPSILGAAGMDTSAVLIATCLASFVGSACMALLANLPFALSAGMGLNAFFAYTVVLGFGYTWQEALLAVFIEGVIFIILSLTKVRESIFNAIPLSLKRAVSIGIGLFAALIVTGSMKGKLKTVHAQAAASQYVKSGSMNITERREMFLYSQIQRHKRETKKSGGSSTHTSSSGRTHGGSSGKF